MRVNTERHFLLNDTHVLFIHSFIQEKNTTTPPPSCLDFFAPKAIDSDFFNSIQMLDVLIW